MHITHLKAGPLAGQAPRTQGRQTPFVGDLGQRVRLVHELRKLAGAKELADRRHHRLSIHQVVRHSGRHLLIDRHLFLDRPLHAHQTDAELVFEQFAHRAYPAITQVVDVVDLADVAAQLEQVGDGGIEVFRLQGALVERRGIDLFIKLDVEFHAAHAREVVLARIEEHATEQLRRGLQGGRIAGPELAVDLDQRVLLRAYGIFLQRRRDDYAHLIPLGKEHLKLFHRTVHESDDLLGGDLRIGLRQHFPALFVRYVRGQVGAFQIRRVGRQALDLRLLDLLQQAARQLAAFGGEQLPFRVADRLG